MNDLATYSAQDIDTLANTKGQELSRINENQLRNFYTAIVRIRIDFQKEKGLNLETCKRNLILLKPKLAYASGRARNLKSYKDFMSEAIDKTVTSDEPRKAFDNFFSLSEAIIAYHKFYSENNNPNR